MERGARVEIRVRGPVPLECADRWGLRAAVAPAHTVLHGTVRDRPALHGVLERLRAGGLEVVDVRPLPPAQAAARGASATGQRALPSTAVAAPPGSTTPAGP